MPADPNVVLGTAPAPAPQRPAAEVMLGAAQYGKFKRDQNAAERSQQAFQAAFQAARRQDGSVDTKSLIAAILPVDPELALDLEGKVLENKRKLVDTAKAEHDAETAKNTIIAQTLRGVTDDRGFQAALSVMPEIGQVVGTEYDPDKIAAAVHMATSASEFNDQQNVLYDRAVEGDGFRSVAGLLSLAKTPEMRENFLYFGRDVADLTDEQLSALASASPEQLASFALTPEKRADVEQDQTTADALAAWRATQTETTRRGQDISAATQRRGQDISAATQRRGQDVSGAQVSALAPTMPSAFQTVVARAMLSVPANRRGLITSTASRLWNEGKVDELKDLIRQAAIESENVAAKDQIRGRAATLASLQDTRAILKELAAAGVPTGWMTGNAEDLARRLGRTTNPQYVTLGNRLMGTLINYRRAATGVQFSERESQDYARMFPNYRNQLPVNLALIDGLEREIQTYDRTYWEGKLGTEGAELIGMLPGDSGAAPTPQADVPSVLRDAAPGNEYTLSDGSVWVKYADGRIERK